MIIILNGPLGIGKSTLAEALSENIDSCVMLDGDHLVAANPPPPDEIEHLHSTIALLMKHHRSFGFRHFVIDHYWARPQEITDLRSRIRAIDPDAEIHCVLLTLPADENLRRIRRRQAAREIDESDFESRTVTDERKALYDGPTADLGEPFDVSEPTGQLVAKLLQRVGLL